MKEFLSCMVMVGMLGMLSNSYRFSARRLYPNKKEKCLSYTLKLSIIKLEASLEVCNFSRTHIGMQLR